MKIIVKEKRRWDKVHNNRLNKLQSERKYISEPKCYIVKNIIKNSYILKLEEECIISRSLDQQVPTKNNTNNIKTKFESFFITYRNIQRILTRPGLFYGKPKLHKLQQ